MIQQMAGDDYQVIKLAVMGEVKAYFRPEFINRIDEVVVFHALDEKHIKSIAKIQLGYLEKRLAAMDMTLEVDDAVLITTRFGRFRSGVWCPAVEARDPVGDRESAGEGNSRGPFRTERRHPRIDERQQAPLRKWQTASSDSPANREYRPGWLAPSVLTDNPTLDQGQGPRARTGSVVSRPLTRPRFK